MKKKLLFLASVLMLTGWFNSLNAQISQGGIPFSFEPKIAGQLDSRLTPEILPKVNVKALLKEDADMEQYKDIPYRFAFGHPVNFSTDNSGKWEQLHNGDRIWRLQITSPGAYSLNLTFDEYELPAGAKLFIYNIDKTDVTGAFTSQNNKPFKQLGTAPVKGESVIVEYYEPSGVTGQGSLRIGTVAHDYKDIYKQAKAFNSSGTCNNNVICPVSAGWEDQIRSVALITTSGGTRICTGALVNNTCQDGTPYFLTADHCLGGESTWVFIFNYDSPQCSPSVDGPLSNSVSGSTLRASNSGSDFALLELSSVPPSGYEVFYAGWDRSGVTSTSQVAIHHPSGDVKKISFDDDPATAVNWSGAACWEVTNWEDGTTEPGSSGSPLFDNNKRVIGQLYGGTASCSSITDDNYGRFDVSWNGSSANTRLVDWLDPCSTGAATDDGYDPNQPSVALDAGISSIASPSNGAEYCDGNIDPVVILRNHGMDTLTQVTINYHEISDPLSTYNWTGSLATNQTETISLPVMTLSPGSFTFEVYTSTPNGGTDANNLNDTLRSNFDIINISAAVLPVTEGFENAAFPPSGWDIDNPDNQVAWERTTDASGFGNSTASAMFNNYDDDHRGEKDYLITPYLDFSGVGSPIELDFNVAYARYDNTLYDSLLIMVSTDCGMTWQTVYSKGNNVLSTTGTDESGEFIPTSTQWRAESVNLDVYQGQPEVQIAFVNVTGWGNNLYLDDINIYGTPLQLKAAFNASDTLVCNGNCVDFTDESTGSPISWEWSFPGAAVTSSGNQNPSGICYNTSGNYNVELIVTDGVDSDTLEKVLYITVVDNPVGSISTTDVSCNGGDDGSATVIASGGTPSYSYQWSEGSTTDMVNGLNAGTYNVTVTDSNGCTVVEAETVSEPAMISIGITTTDASCGMTDGEASVNAGGGTSPYTYLWSTGQTTATITGLAVGTYYITVTDDSLCSISDTVVIENIGAPTLSLTVTDVSCYDGSDGKVEMTVTGDAPFEYLWTNGSTTKDISGLIAGMYEVTVTDVNECIRYASVQVTQPSQLLITDSVTNETCCPGDNDGEITTSVSGGSPGYQYLWSNNATTGNISGLAAGNYHLTVTDGNDCLLIVSYTVEHDSVNTGIGHSADHLLDVKLFPNPAGGRFFITYKLQKEEKLQVRVWNILGALIAETNTPLSIQGKVQIDLSGRAEGLYFVEISAGTYRTVEKVVLR